ncbi:hypothetical protein QYF36_018994 [Acer negundo]|nr:hypothetical protein QYF36_018994 [Acer negundo]
MVKKIAETKIQGILEPMGRIFQGRRTLWDSAVPFWRPRAPKREQNCSFSVPAGFDSSMPRASKNQKGKSVAASGSSVRVHNPNFHVQLEKNLGRVILSERNIDLNNLIGSKVP